MGFGRAFGSVDTMHIEHQMWLAWHSLKRTGRTTVDFQTWLDTVDEMGEQETAPAPLDATPNTG